MIGSAVITIGVLIAWAMVILLVREAYRKERE